MISLRKELRNTIQWIIKIKLKKSLKSRKIKIAFPDASKEEKVILKENKVI